MSNFYPNQVASGQNNIDKSLLFTGTQYVDLGQPAALTSVLNATHEFTILVRTCRSLSGSSGEIIGKHTTSLCDFGIYSTGGSQCTANIGGVTFTTGSGSIKNPTWSTIGMVNRNASGTFMGRIVLDANTSSTEVAVGTQTCSADIMIGARRNLSNTDFTAYYSGFIGCIAIWNYAMTDSQMYSAMAYLCPSEVLYSSFNGTNYATGLVAYYPCNDPLGTTIIHDCVQGLDGTASSSSLLSTAQFSHYPLIAWGDSLVNAAGSQTSTGFQNQLAGGGGGIRQGRSICSRGYSGMNVAYVASQMPPGNPTSMAFMTWTYLMLPGAHDFGATSNVTSFLTTAISGLPHNRYVVLGQIPYGVGTGSGPSSGSATQDWGTVGRVQIDQMNSVVQVLMGNRYVNLQIPVAGLSTLPSEANDLFQLRTPAHVVSSAGAPHPQDAGYIEWSLLVDPFLTGLNPMW